MSDLDGEERRGGRVVVHHVVNPEAGLPFRRVTIFGQPVGKAYGLQDVIELIRRVGLDVEDPDLVDWEGGDSQTWE
ncbi:hypothetical protein [Streptacidiphilus sp. MAP5-3]|uniref:hypothetical protein n=1 Tax=unclassified Streptacidiphilus TaxID=2643834 RepID=UPI0035132356